MGTDKGLIQFRDKTMIEFALQMVMPYCNEVLISSNNEAYSKFGYPVVPDEIVDIGPIGGIMSCLKKAKYEKVFITACDIPEIDTGILQSLFNVSTQNDVVSLKLPSGRIQSLPLLLSMKTLGIIESLIRQKSYALYNLISECKSNAGIASQEILIREEPWNINTLNDLGND